MMDRWTDALERIGITYTFTFRPPYNTSLDAIRHALHRAGLHLFLLRPDDENAVTLICLRSQTFHVALLLAAMNASFPPPPPGVAHRPSRRWGIWALQPFHLPPNTVNMLLNVYTSSP